MGTPDPSIATPALEAFLDCQTIPGWMTKGESIALYWLAAGVPNENPVCCEIGTWLGKSAVLIAKALRNKRNPKHHCVDPFDLVKDEAWHQKTFTQQMGLPILTRKQTFLRTLKVHGVSDIVEPFEGFSAQAAPRFDRRLDLLFIDGDHAYDGVIADYRAWAPKLKVGGILCFHDYHPPGTQTPHDGPQRVVHEEIIDNPRWINQRRTEKLYAATLAD